MLNLPKVFLKNCNLKLLKESLSLTPTTTDYVTGKPEPPVHFYVESSNSLKVPRQWAIDNLQTYDKALTPGIMRQYVIDSPRLKLPSFIHPDKLNFKATLKTGAIPQVSAMTEVVDSLKEYSGAVLSLPCGWGKTACALKMASYLRLKVLVLVDKESLMDQWVKRTAEFLPDCKVGIVQQKVCQISSSDICIGMIHSLAMCDYPDGTFDEIGLMVADEAHHVCARTLSRALFRAEWPYVMALTATPYRNDGLETSLQWFFSPKFVIRQRPKENNRESVFRVKEYHADPPQEPVLMRNGDPNWMAIYKQLAADTNRNLDIIEELSSLMKNGRTVLGLSELREHLIDIHSMCKDEKLDSGLYMGGMKPEARAESALKRIILATTKIAKEGIDLRDPDTIFFMMPPTGDLTQFVGRVQRDASAVIKADKKFALIICFRDDGDHFNGRFWKCVRWFKDYEFKVMFDKKRGRDSPDNDDDEGSVQVAKRARTSKCPF